tara:strand:+ start:629 stop:1216 length:588 start_codon:yes stop_codon:yes gene_type:complete
MSLNLSKEKKIIEVLTPIFLLIIIIILLFNNCNKNKENNIIIDNVVVKKPENECRAHFSGLLMSDQFEESMKSKLFVIDDASEYVGEGEYPRAIEAFPKSDKATFDGIGIDKGTRVIIYEEQFFKGKILLDEVGPIIITNKIRLEEEEHKKIVHENNNKVFSDDLNNLFPPNKRVMSNTNMFDWSKGSLKVICNE